MRLANLTSEVNDIKTTLMEQQAQLQHLSDLISTLLHSSTAATASNTTTTVTAISQQAGAWRLSQHYYPIRLTGLYDFSSHRLAGLYYSSPNHLAGYSIYDSDS